ncbi:hypothetical protein [Mesorhizobium sp. WSM3860]|uniref:hypothetical protein n=1 Tax=Mesorhizobium sp. WSM3860 TaxID=2029403 RepID=UPI000BAEF966|nr:hypothetical protein [Mesorhizobium sp. WSM3860]PBC00621.1 hypothetical protein CK220_30310 [Mesorhizobium sp. WSM3860]
MAISSKYHCLRLLNGLSSTEVLVVSLTFDLVTDRLGNHGQQAVQPEHGFGLRQYAPILI